MKAMLVAVALAALPALPASAGEKMQTGDSTHATYRAPWLGPADASGRRPLVVGWSARLPDGCLWRLEGVPAGLRVRSSRNMNGDIYRELIGWARGSFDVEMVIDPCRTEGSDWTSPRRVYRRTISPYETDSEYTSFPRGWGIEEMLGPRWLGERR